MKKHVKLFSNAGLFLLLLTLGIVKSYAQFAEIKPNQGISVPQFTTVFINALTTQPKGTVVFDKDLNVMKYWDGLTWQSMGANAASGWMGTGANLVNTNTGNVGIGLSNPSKAKFEIGTTNTTTAVFGSSSTGISLQQNFPTVGFNQYRDAGNVPRFIGMGYGLVNYLDPLTGTLNWNSTGTGAANTGTSAETSLMTLSKFGDLGIKYLSGPSNGISLSGGNSINAIGSSPLNYGSLQISSNDPGFPASFNQALLFDKNSIQSRSSSIIVGGSTTENNLRLNPFGGKVGINSGGINLTANLEVYRSPTSNAGSAVFKGTTHYSHFHFGNTEDTYIRGGKDGSAVIINDGGLGNVGVGVFPSLYKLEVNGTMRAKEVIVETGWADYVFEKNYKLKTIDEMEEFIHENKHLPNIPSAKDIESKGLKIGETNKAMMEKIEELALYIIQLNKKIEVLESKK